MVTTYSINNVNEVTSASTAGGGTVSYIYDAKGNLISQVASGLTTNYSFDATNQLIGISSPTQSETLQYDPLGNLISTTTNGQVVNYAVDPLQGSIAGEYDSSGNVFAHFITGLSLVSQVAPETSLPTTTSMLSARPWASRAPQEPTSTGTLTRRSVK